MLNLEGIDISGLSNVSVPKKIEGLQEEDTIISKRKKYNSSILKWANEYGIDSDYLSASLAQESAFNPTARSKTGAAGIAQFTGATAKQTAYELGDEIAELEPEKIKDILTNDPDRSIKYSAYYQKKLLKTFNGDEEKAIAAYNAGPGAVRQAISKFGSDWLDNIKYVVGDAKGREVKNHVKKVMNYKNKFKKEFKTDLNLTGIDFGPQKPTEIQMEPLDIEGETEKEKSFIQKLGRSSASSLFGIESALAASPGFVVDALALIPNVINYGINKTTKAIFGKKFLKEDYKAPKELYDIGGTIAEKTETEKSYLAKSLSSESLKKAQQKYSESSKMNEPGKGIAVSLYDKIKRGEITEAAEYLTLSTVEQVPQNILAAVASIALKNPMAGIAILGGTSSVNEMQDYYQKKEEGKQTPSHTLAVLNAINNGLMEVAGEMTGTVKILAPLRQQFLKMAKKEGMEYANKKATSFAIALLKNVFGEVKSEVFTQIGQDLGAMFTGTKDITLKQLASNIGDAGLLAVTSSGPFATISAATESKQSKQEIGIEEETEQNQPTIKNKSFWKHGSIDEFINHFNDVSGEAKRFMLSKLTDNERQQVLDYLKKPETQITEEKINDQENQIGIPSEEQIGEKPIEEKPVEEAGKETTPTGGMVQEPLKIKITKEQWSQMSNNEISDLENKFGNTIEFEGLKEIDEERRKNFSKGTPPGTATVEEELRPVFAKTEGSKINPETGEVEKLKDIEITRHIRQPLNEKKALNEYSTNDFIEMANDRKGIQKIKTIISEVGIKLPSRSPWQSFVYEYAKKFGTTEDIENIESIIETKQQAISKGVELKKQERLKQTGDERTKLQKNKSLVLKEIENEGIVEYDKDKHSFIVKEMVKDEQGNYKPIFFSNQFSKALDIETVDGKPFLKIKEISGTKKGKKVSSSGLEILQDIEVSTAEKGGGKMINLEKPSKSKNIEEIEIEEENLTEKETPSKEIVTSKEKIESVKSAIKNVRNKLEKDLKSKKITQEVYDKGIRTTKAMEQDYGLVKYDEDFSDIQYSKKLEDINPNKPIKYLTGTEEDIKRGKNLASKLGIIFNGFLEGMEQEGNILREPEMMFSDPKDQDTFTVPINATEKTIQDKKITKVKAFEIAKQFEEVKKVFKNLGTELPKLIVTNQDPKTGKQFPSYVFGALITNKENNQQQLIINSAIDQKTVLPTLLHELWGHYGAEKVISYIDPKLGQFARDLFEKDKNSYEVKQIAKMYSNAKTHKELLDWVENNNEILFNEWIANNVEKLSKTYFDKNGKFLENTYNQDKSILKKVYNFVEKLVDKIFEKWFNKRSTNKEKQMLVRAISQQFSQLGKTKELTTEKIQYSKKISTTKKHRLKTYVKDRLNLELVEDIDELQVRYFDFANKHFYGTGAESFKRQIFNMIDNVKEIGDNKYKQLLKTIDEFSDWEDAKNIYSQFKSFKKQNRKILSKDNDILNKINNDLNHIEKRYNQFLTFQTLKRLGDRGVVDRPFKKGTQEYTNPSTKYQNLLDKGYVEIESFNEGSYELSDLGKNELKKLRSILTNENGDMFGVINIEEILNKAKEQLKEQRTTNKDIKISKKKTISQANEEIIQRIIKLKPSFAKGTKIERLVDWIKKGDLTTTNLEYILNKLDGFEDGPLTKYIFNPLNDGREAIHKFKHDITDLMQEELKKIPRNILIKMSPSFQTGVIGNIEKNITKKPDVWNFRTEKSGNVKLNIAQKISLYMISQNENGIRHLLNGGISLTHKSDIIKLTANDIEHIHNNMTKYEKIVAKMYFKIADIIKEKGNAVSEQDVGYNIFSEEDYHPLLVRSDYVQNEIKEIKNLDQLRKYIIKTSPSALKQRTKSNAPLILEGVFDAFSRTAPMIEQYIGAALPSKNVQSILLNKEFKQEMYKKGLDVEYNAISHLVDNFNGNMMYKPQIGESLLRTIQNIFTTAVLGYKIPVVLIQPVSYYSYLAALGDISVPQKVNILMKGHSGAFGLVTKEFDRIKDLVWKYSPSLRERFEGHGDYAIGEQKKSSESRTRITGGKQGWRRWLSAEGALSPMIGMDQRACAMVWRAVEEELSLKGMEKGTDQFYRAVAKRTTDVVRRTQATSDMLDRPAIMNSMLLKPLTMFTSEPIKRMMLVRRIVNDIQKGKPNGWSSLTMLLVIQPLMVEVIRTGLLKARGKDDLPEEASEYFSWFAKRIAINNIALYPVLGAAIATAASGYDINLGGPTQELMNRMAMFSKKMWESTIEGKSWEKTMKSLKRVAEMLGAVQSGEHAKEIIENVIKQIEE